jgi:hypothetical protein
MSFELGAHGPDYALTPQVERGLGAWQGLGVATDGRFVSGALRGLSWSYDGYIITNGLLSIERPEERATHCPSHQHPSGGDKESTRNIFGHSKSAPNSWSHMLGPTTRTYIAAYDRLRG